MSYLTWNQQTISDFEDNRVSEMYEKGFLFTRLGRGVMDQTRAVRIKLAKFELSSENRRILKKMEGISLKTSSLPDRDYDFPIGKLAKDFYATKFGPGIMSAQKIKELMTSKNESNFNCLFKYIQNEDPLGYTIAYVNPTMIHYSYPFYDLEKSPKSMGLGMMTLAIMQAKEKGLKNMYLGSLQRPADTYKLQFSGLEWFDGKEWQTDLEKAKELLK